MFWKAVTEEEVQPKIYLNGFPKAGLHLLELMIRGLIQPQPNSLIRDGTWAGTYGLGGFGSKFLPVENILYKQSQLQPGFYLKGHCGYSEEIEQFQYASGFSHIFIYRDLRDVAISQAYHARSVSSTANHPAKDMFSAMSFGDALLYIINGLGNLEGLVNRWEKYAQWKEVAWALSISFEDVLSNREKEAKKILEYTLNRVMSVYKNFGVLIQSDETNVNLSIDRMVKMSRQTFLSNTFRKGTVGQWKEHFKKEHLKAFEQTGGNEWLERLGYEV
jgi:hypothetical protein